MNTRIPLWVRDLIPFFYKYRVTRVLFRPLFHIYSKRIAENRNHLFLTNGVRVLQEFDTVMLQNSINYSVFAGTLLGAIREKGLLKHDLDLDTVMFNRDYSPKNRVLLEEAGFKLVHAFLVDNGEKAREETYEKDGVSIDIYYIYEDEKFPTYQCDFFEMKKTDKHNMVARVRRIEFPVSYEVVRVPFENIQVNAIANAREWLRCRYGDDYMIPNPGFRDKGDNPHIFVWDGVYASMMMY